MYWSRAGQNRHGRRFLLLGKIFVSGALLWWVAAKLDLSEVTDLFARLGAPMLTVSLGLVIVQNVVIAWRWYRVVELLGGVMTASFAIRWTFVGLFFNQALPGAVGGDLIRMWKLKQSGTGADIAFASVAIERITGIVLLSVLITLCVPSIWRETDHFILLVLLTLGPALGATLYSISRWHEKLVRHTPTGVGRLITSFGEGMKRLVHKPFRMLEVMGLGVAASLTGILSAYVIALHLGMIISFPAFVSLLGAAILFSVLPVSAGGWGVREAGAVMIFSAAGVPPEQALTVSIAYGLLPLVVSIPVGLVLWMLRTAPPRAESSGADPSRSEG